MFVATKNVLNSLNLKVVLALGATAGCIYYLYTRKYNVKAAADDEKTAADGNEESKTVNSDTSATKTNSSLSVEITGSNAVAVQFKLEGNKLFAIDEYTEAAKLYTKAIEVCKADHKEDLSNFYYNRAFCYEKLGDYDNALLDLENAVKNNTHYKKAYLKLGRIKEGIGKYEDALIDYTALNVIGKFTSAFDQKIMDTCLNKVIEPQLKKNDLENKFVIPSKTTIDSYMKTFVNDPIFSRTYPINGLNKEQGEKFEEAKKFFCNAEMEKALELIEPLAETNDYLAVLFRATIYLFVGSTKKSYDDLTKIVEDAENIEDKSIVVNALLKMASCNLKNRDVIKCHECLEKAIEFDENDSDIYFQKGQLGLLHEEYEQSLRDFEKSVHLQPTMQNSVNKLYIEFRYFLEKGSTSKVNRVLNDLKDLMEKYSNEIFPHFMLAQMNIELSRMSEAEDCLERAEKMDGKNPLVWFHKALMCLHCHEDINKAVELLDKSLSLDPNAEQVIETLASIEFQRGNQVRASELMEKLLNLTTGRVEYTDRLRTYHVINAHVQVMKKYKLM